MASPFSPRPLPGVPAMRRDNVRSDMPIPTAIEMEGHPPPAREITDFRYA